MVTESANPVSTGDSRVALPLPPSPSPFLPHRLPASPPIPPRLPLPSAPDPRRLAPVGRSQLSKVGEGLRPAAPVHEQGPPDGLLLAATAT